MKTGAQQDACSFPRARRPRRDKQGGQPVTPGKGVVPLQVDPRRFAPDLQLQPADFDFPLILNDLTLRERKEKIRIRQEIELRVSI